MRQLQSSVKQVARAGPAKKRGVRVACARKHFFVLIFCGPPRGYFLYQDKK